MTAKLKMPTQAEFQHEINEFYKSAADHKHRYASFDICYNYFRNNKTTLKADIEKSCCVLWSYLGSWGMLRGSSFLLQEKNPAFLVELIVYIQDDCQDIFDIDVDKYDDANIERLLDVYNEIYELLGGDKNKPSSTLITKIMLGVFGCIPAFDQFFCNTMGDLMLGSGIKSKIVHKKSLKAIYHFYIESGLQNTIDKCSKSCKVVDVFTQKITQCNYSKAKIIDMYGFSAGLD